LEEHFGIHPGQICWAVIRGEDDPNLSKTLEGELISVRARFDRKGFIVFDLHLKNGLKYLNLPGEEAKYFESEEMALGSGRDGILMDFGSITDSGVFVESRERLKRKTYSPKYGHESNALFKRG